MSGTVSGMHKSQRQTEQIRAFKCKTRAKLQHCTFWMRYSGKEGSKSCRGPRSGTRGERDGGAEIRTHGAVCQLLQTDIIRQIFIHAPVWPDYTPSTPVLLCSDLVGLRWQKWGASLTPHAARCRQLTVMDALTSERREAWLHMR